MENLANLPYVTKEDPAPFEHQQRCFYKLYEWDYAGIFGEQGTGKTRMVIDLLANHFVQGNINAVLLIAPKGVHEQWHDEQVPIHCPVPYGRFLWSTSQSKIYKSRLKKFYEAEDDLLKWFFVNVDIFSSDRHIPVLREFLKTNKAAIVVDESTRIKNPNANRTFNIMYNMGIQYKQGRKISKLVPYSEKRYILTGMPTTGSPYDLWAPFEFLKFGFFDMNFYAFKAKYGIEVQDKNKQTGQKYSRKITATEIASILKYFKGGYSSEQIGNILGISVANIDYICSHPNIRFPYKHLDELKAKIEPMSFTVTKKECLDLPAKIYTKTVVEMSREQAKVYKDLRDKMLAEYGDKELTVTSKLALLTRLQQVVAGFFPYLDQELDEEEGVWYDRPRVVPIGAKNPKVEAVKRELEELGDVKVFIACRFVAEIELAKEQLQKAFPDKSIAAYYGSIRDAERKRITDRFKAGELDILIMNIRMAIGFNFQEVCHNSFALSGTYSLEDRKQWEDRTDRIGQVNHPLYRDFIAKGTVDEKIYKAIESKQNLLDYFRDHSLSEFI